MQHTAFATNTARKEPRFADFQVGEAALVVLGDRSQAYKTFACWSILSTEVLFSQLHTEIESKYGKSLKSRPFDLINVKIDLILLGFDLSSQLCLARNPVSESTASPEEFQFGLPG